MTSSSSSSSGAISFTGLLQILFIGLKLTNHIAWPWWQVMLPTIIGLGIVGVIVLVGILLTVSDLIHR
jgi:hypothetical protein